MNLLYIYLIQRYCDAQGLPTPRAPCDPGYICISGAYRSTPTDGKTGSPCPAGGFCTSGQFKSEPCPPGTYSNAAGAINNQDCQTCDPGYYCEKSSSPSPDGPCNPGFYCSKGAVSPNETESSPGHYSPRGSSDHKPCDVGTYQPYKVQSRCFPCTPGHFCNQTRMSTTNPCPVGYYCPEGSEVPQFCPAGTFNSFTRKSSLSDCLPCPPGKYCEAASSSISGMILNLYICYVYI